MADAIRYVDPGSAGGNGTTTALTGANAAYASLNAAVDAEFVATPNLVTSDVRLVILCRGGAADGVQVSIPAFTTDATRYIDIGPDTGQGAAASGWQTGRYRLVQARTFDGIFTGAIPLFTRIHNLQIENTGSKVDQSMGFYITPAAGTDSLRIYGNRIRFTGAGTADSFCAGINLLGTAAYTVRWYRNIVETGGVAIRSAYNTSGKLFGANNTSINNTGGMYDCNSDHAEVRLYNEVAQCSVTRIATTLDFNSFGAPAINTRDYCLSEDASADDVAGTSNVISTAVAFEGEAGGDFRLAAGDTAARNTGTDLSGNAYIPHTLDLDGQTVSGTWDRGASELVAVASRPTRPLVVSAAVHRSTRW